MRECVAQDFFESGHIIPLTVVYEDFIADYEGTVKRILEFLEISYETSLLIAPPAYEKLADEISERWVQRYRREKQMGWANYW